MKRFVKLNLSTIIALIAAFYLAYYFLLKDNFLHISISSIIAKSHQLTEAHHMVVLGLLPIYIALMIFGAGLIGLFIGSILQQILSRTINRQVVREKSILRNSPIYLCENSHKACKH